MAKPAKYLYLPSQWLKAHLETREARPTNEHDYYCDIYKAILGAIPINHEDAAASGL